MPSLKETLYQQSSTVLRQIMEGNQFDISRYRHVTSKRQLIELLETDLLRGRNLYTHALGQCNAHHLRCMQIAVSLLKTTRVVADAAFIEATGGKGAQSVVESIVQELSGKGLLYRIPEGIYVPSGLEDALPLSLSDRKPLAKYLNDYDAGTVRAIRNSWNLATQKDTKALNAEAITTFLLETADRDMLRAKLNPEELAVLDHVMNLGGAATINDIVEKFFASKSSYYYRYNWQTRWQSGEAENGLESLLIKGLLYGTWYGYGYSMTLVIPGDLLRVLSGQADNSFWLAPPRELTAWQGVPQVTSQHSAIISDIALFLSQIAAQEASRTNSGVIHKTFLKATRRLFRFQSEEYAFFVFALCSAAKFIEAPEATQLYRVTEKGRSWLYWEEEVQIRVLFEAWKYGTYWQEILSDPLAMSDYGSLFKSKLLDVREKLLNILVASKEDTFLETASFARAIAFQHPLLFVMSTQMEAPLSGVNIMEGFLGGVLYWLGLIELVWESPDPNASEEENRRKVAALFLGNAESFPKPTSFRLTPRGKSCLAGEPLPSASIPREEQFLLQANGEVVGAPYLSPAVLYRLVSISDIPKNGTWQTAPSITKESLRRALDKGETTESILAFLQEHSRVGIPQNIGYLIQEVGGKHGHIHIGTAQFYIQVATPILLKELKARKDLKFRFVRELSDTIAILEADDLQKILRDLRKAGYLPTADDNKSVASETSATFEPLEPPKPTPAPTAALSQSQRRGMAADAVDWDIVGKEDGAEWKQQVMEANNVTIPAGGQSNQNMIRFLCTQAIQKRVSVELGVLPEGASQVVVYRINPKNMTDKVLGGDEFETHETKLFYFAEIIWVRLLSR